MERAVVIFANGEHLNLSAGQVVYPIFKIVHNGEQFVSRGQPIELAPHTHDGMIPSIADLILTCEFFSTLKDCSKLYKTTAVVSIENI